ncbi:MAG: Pr6Pr family membrane protein [Methylocella sp.]
MSGAPEPGTLSSSARAADFPRVCAGVLAILGWTAIGIELNFIISGALGKGAPLAPALIRYFSFFTIETHVLLALVLTASCLRPDADSFFLRPGVRTAVVVYVIMVGAVYAILLRGLYRWTGSVLVADRILHVVLPIFYPLYWLAFIEKGHIKRVYPLVWMIFPILYFIYILLRGAILDVYPYPFLDVAKLGYDRVILNALGLMGALLALGLLVAAIDHALAAQKSRGGGALGRAADF